MSALTVAVQAEIEAAGTADIAIVNIVRDVRHHHSELCDAFADAAIDRLITGIAKRYLKPSATDAPRLPGFDELPLRITVAVEGGFIYRSTRCSTEADLDAYEQILVEQIKADQARLKEYRTGKRKLVHLLRTHGVATLEDLP